MCGAAARRRAERRQELLASMVNRRGKPDSIQKTRQIPIASTEDRHPDQPPPSYAAAANSERVFTFDPIDVDRMPVDDKALPQKSEYTDHMQGAYDVPLSTTPSLAHLAQSVPSTVMLTPASSRRGSVASADVCVNENAETYYSLPPHDSLNWERGPCAPPYTTSRVTQTKGESSRAALGGVSMHGEDYTRSRGQQHPLMQAGNAVLGVAGGLLGGFVDRREKRHAAIAMKWHKRRCVDTGCWCREGGATYRGGGLLGLGGL